jgi:hypothetical protein
MRILIRIRNTAFHYNTISSGFRKTVFVATRGSFKPVGIEHQRLSVISGKLFTFFKLCKEVLLFRISKLETVTKKVPGTDSNSYSVKNKYAISLEIVSLCADY